MRRQSRQAIRNLRPVVRARQAQLVEANGVHIQPERVEGCEHCARLTEFVLPEAIIQAVNDGKLALFAGAGISTEGRGVFQTTLYEDIAAGLNIDPRTGPPFPVLMSRYCAQQDGRRKLILQIRSRLDYLKAFPEVGQQATRFHAELATIPFLNEIFTTNWDALFEQVCGAVPIVTAPDFVFWDLPGRKVFKLHGSVSSYSSLVLTEEDYRASYEALSSGLIGATLKLALATKTLVFVGYSLNDSDLEQLYRAVMRELGDFSQRAYIVILDGARKTEYEQLGLVPIIADGAHFMSALKSVLVARRMMFPDEIRGLIRIALRYIGDLHGEFPERFDQRRQPLAILTAAYQDGLIHALQRLDSKYNAGESDPHRLHHKIRSYEVLRRDKLRHRDYFNVAYIDGYINGLTYPLVAWEDPRVKPPAYYVCGAGPIEGLGENREALRTAKERYPRVQGAATAIAQGLPPNSGITVHHFPFL